MIAWLAIGISVLSIAVSAYTIQLNRKIARLRRLPPNDGSRS